LTAQLRRFAQRQVVSGIGEVFYSRADHGS
jgi:hypothetical protein